MSKMIYGPIVTIILGIIGSLLATYIKNNYLIALGYFLVIVAAAILVIELYRNYPSIFGIKWRYASTVIVFDEDRVLLIWHPYHKVWLPPGQRIAFQQYPHQAALAAVRKETGYEVAFDNRFHFEEKTIDRDTEQIPQPCFVMKETQGHRRGIKEHYDLYYICLLKGHSPQLKGVLDQKWFRVSELESLVEKGELYKDILFIVNKAYGEQHSKDK